MSSIRTATIADAADVRAIYAPIIETSAISFESEPPSVDEMARRITSTLARAPWLVAIADDGAMEGYAYAGAHRSRAAYQWSVEVSVYVSASHRRRGVARRLYAVLFDVLIAQGFCLAYAGITLPNPGSVGLHTSLGFEPVGVYKDVGYKSGAWRDVGWWQRRLIDPLPTPPTPPTPFPTLLTHPEAVSRLEQAHPTLTLTLNSP